MTDRFYLGEFEQVVLLAVARLAGDGYGMTVRREIERRTGRAVSIGAVYATLDRLERKGLVSSREGESTPERGGRARRHFVLERAGAQALRRTQRMLEQMWADVELGAPRKAGTS
ncbi:MAG TPA: helix-turn-helix transcriptional regulator [Gemmatimonadaceae bacterium]|nr:helix-turn-helix transcriptional regulator [Gemmatimonadaceae bacterium]